MNIIILISSILLSISSVILLVINPLSIGIIILIIAIILTLVYSSILSSWIAFLIFLIYVRGILVIFSYFVSLIPNQSNNIIYLSLPLTILLILIMINIINPTIIKFQTKTLKYINTFYSMNNSTILIILALSLLIVIVVVVKIVVITKGPLRPFIKYV